ncbi:MAG TPA: hypothetical protein VMI32_06845 [Candidatus Solibacter sp.]|nr:hypothetical protein [Candidatus Solibacter sp.]
MSGTIFISCGQYTRAEKLLGKRIVDMVRSQTNLTPYFAEEVQDLYGLDSNILNALRDCVAFITVLHPRGTISRPEAPPFTRASVWIEQEIAIATYINRVENRTLPIIAFRHKSVGLEGIRSLLHLNPIEFAHEEEVLAELSGRLSAWTNLQSSIQLQLTSELTGIQQEHRIHRLILSVANHTSRRFEKYDYELSIPSAFLRHWNSNYACEIQSKDPNLRYFRFDESNTGRAIMPRDEMRLTFLDFCTACAATNARGYQDLVAATAAAETPITGILWIDSRELTISKTVKQLAIDREKTGKII